jgi:nicotinate-nucleotide adenylyltransferase
MVELALLGEEGLFASTHELTLGRAAYTVETVEHFLLTRPDWDLHLVLGADSFAELRSWRRWRDLLRLVRVVVLARPGWDSDHLLARVPEEQAAAVRAGRVVFVANRLWDLSSSRIREGLARGDSPTAEACPESVLHYVSKYALYR